MTFEGIPKFEKPRDLLNEQNFYKRFTERTHLQVRKSSEFAHCDRDIFNYRGVLAISEYRRRFNSRFQYKTLAISARKVFHGIERAKSFKVPFFYFIEWDEGDYAYQFHPGRSIELHWEWGGHSLNKMRYEYDREYMIHIPPANFLELSSPTWIPAWEALADGTFLQSFSGYTQDEVSELKRRAYRRPDNA